MNDSLQKIEYRSIIFSTSSIITFLPKLKKTVYSTTHLQLTPVCSVDDTQKYVHQILEKLFASTKTFDSLRR